MSPGRIAWPDGMFSVAPTTPITRTGSPSRAIAPTAATTAAPPDMSNFISCIFAAGLIEMPPVSKVTALPTRPSTGPRRVRAVVAHDDQRGVGVAALRDGGERAHAAGRCRKSRPCTSTLTPSSARAASARAAGVRSLAGVFCRSRATVAAWATTAAASDRARDVVVGGDDQLLDRAVVRRRRPCSGEPVGGEHACPRRARPSRRRRRGGAAPSRAPAPDLQRAPEGDRGGDRARVRRRTRRARRGRRAAIGARPRGRRRGGGRPCAPRPSRARRWSAPSSTSCATPSPSNTPTTSVSAPESAGEEVVR